MNLAPTMTKMKEDEAEKREFYIYRIPSLKVKKKSKNSNKEKKEKKVFLLVI